jgi:uncharacterized delta-60 repeat protein
MSTLMNKRASLWISILTILILATCSLPVTEPQVDTPTFSPPGGNYGSAQNVAISCATAGASVRYTTDDSTPTSDYGILYSGPVSVSSETTLKAIAYKAGMSDSKVGSATYTFLETVATPTFSPPGGIYSSAQNVTIECATAGAAIRYTTDDSTPTSDHGVLYSEPASVSATTTLKAMAFKDGMADSEVASAVYTILMPGDLDPTFLASGTGANDAVRSIALQSDGKILIGGDFVAYNSVDRAHVARLESDGVLDTSFLGSGSGATNRVYAVVLQPDGKVLIGGLFETCDGTDCKYLARLESDGSLDTSFLASGSGLDNWVHSVALQPDGKVLVGGWFNSYNELAVARIARLNSDASPDTDFFSISTGTSGSVECVVVQPDDKILIGGGLVTYNGAPRGKVARINSDGSVDSFLDGLDGANNTVYAVCLQPDGKVLIGGEFTSCNGSTRNHLARLNSDGTLDISFLDAEDGVDGTVYSLAVQSDGKILVGGAFTSCNGSTRNHLARLESDGSLDTSFLASGAGANNTVYAITLQSDGMILIGGAFSSYNGVSIRRIARIQD